MSDTSLQDQSLDSAHGVLRDSLIRDRRRHGKVRSALSHLLQVDGQELLNDEVVARIRGMALDVANRLLTAHDELEYPGKIAGNRAASADNIALGLVSNGGFLAHTHMLVLEGQLSERLRLRSGVDVVAPKLLTDLIGSDHPELASLAMSVLTSQARFIQNYRRMELPIEELPADVFHSAVVVLRDSQEGPLRGEPQLRISHDEGHSRLSLMDRLLVEMGPTAPDALQVQHAGVALFASALGHLSGDGREAAVASMADNQSMRLSILMRAAGLDRQGAEAQMLALQMDSEENFAPDTLLAHEAVQWLSATAI